MIPTQCTTKTTKPGFPDLSQAEYGTNVYWMKTLLTFLGNPITLPNVPAMGYFPLYNHTNDEDYIVKTGKDNTDNLALIQKWANMTNLPWWGDSYSSDITNSGDGTFQKPGLKKDDKLKQFQSFACRYALLSLFSVSSNALILPDTSYPGCIITSPFHVLLSALRLRHNSEWHRCDDVQNGRGYLRHHQRTEQGL
ncbi:hypothetical protein ANCCEY_06959 [Ancylostoma ceylanicum]|uniref:Uncharacterized protein n=1 Tax=Ancylostoma ceylanicum TaxID=53326 RepID=A0A0D6LPG2_9BILA|nr:hypothetical protein ANCCEY_06959 [Ancylostoma ceylanicum]